MNRTDLLDLLRAHQPADAHEAAMTGRMVTFVETHPDCFQRSLLMGHVTASAWVLDPTRRHVLLLHHRKLDRWLQPGGHCDGDPDVRAVAQREAEEETGLAVRLLDQALFDVDIHPIPARGDVPAHAHFDVRFRFEADFQPPVVRLEEAREARWVPLDEVSQYADEESIRRMVRKGSVGS
jgi:8-oxo-dGTP pyrophosphatase MutT (NUDIX family)